MPQAPLKISSALGIRLTGEPPIFAYGDTITGCVFRGTHIVTTEAVVTVTLFGRTKTKAIAPLGTGSKLLTNRGRYTIIDEQSCIQTIFRGPLHIPSSPRPEEVEQSWQFAIVVPITYDDADQTLPGTFTTNPMGLPKNDEAFVEFAVKAELQSVEQGTVRTATAILPVTIRALSLDPPIANFQPKQWRIYGLVSSSHLLPGAPSLLQRTRMRLGSSVEPSFAGHLEVDSPTILQLEHPDPIPLRLRLIPDTKVILGSGIHDIPQEIQLIRLTMEIHATTEIGGDDHSMPHAIVRQEPVSIRVWSPLALGPDTPLLHIPCGTEAVALNVGERADLRIGYRGLIRNRIPQGNIYPSFSLRNIIKHTHRFTFKLQAKIAKVDLEFKWETKANILPPSDLREPANMRTTHQALQSRSRAETDEEAPPAYQES